MNQASARSSNVDDTQRQLSILDESEINDVLNFLAKESKNVDSVWGDIYRNQFLNTVRNAPREMSLDGTADGCHPSI